MGEIMKDVCQKLNNHRGMTLVEVLISLSIFLIIVSILPSVFSLWNKGDELSLRHEEMVIFFSQLQREFRENHIYWTNDEEGILYLSSGGDWDTVQYEKYNNLIRRRVNRQGHEVFIQNVAVFRVKARSFGVEIFVKGLDGKEYRKNFIHSSHLGEDK